MTTGRNPSRSGRAPVGKSGQGKDPDVRLEVPGEPVSVVGLHPPLSWTSLEAAERRALFADVADAGIPHVAVGDHIGFRKQHGFDGLINATAILAAEPRLAVVLAVYLLPHRHPVLVARQLSTLAELAPGRLVFGVGVGGEDPGEARMCGIENEGRGKRANESLALLRRLLAGETVTAAGAYYQLDDVYVGPPPRCGISVLVGGRSDAAIRRAAIHGDGWLGLWASPDRFGQVVEEIEAMARAEGRDHPSRHALNVWCAFGPDRREARARLAEEMASGYGIPFERFEKWCPVGDPESVAEFLLPYVKAGCRSFNLLARGASPRHIIDGVAAVGQFLRNAAA
jgi:alkanesulfonate monooxygenase SsuD/methylene tetrahydromethanopterin reductase-like flavin-dependent oxidoreductase (luciferase family)